MKSILSSYFKSLFTLSIPKLQITKRFYLGIIVLGLQLLQISDLRAQCNPDLTPPTISCVPNQVRATNPGVCTYTVSGTEFNPILYGDNCGTPVIQNDLNLTPSLAGAVFPKGITTVVWKVTDGAGNTATCSFILTVNDNEKPSISCPTNITLQSSPGICGRIVTFCNYGNTLYASND